MSKKLFNCCSTSLGRTRCAGCDARDRLRNAAPRMSTLLYIFSEQYQTLSTSVPTTAPFAARPQLNAAELEDCRARQPQTNGLRPTSPKTARDGGFEQVYTSFGFTSGGEGKWGTVGHVSCSPSPPPPPSATRSHFNHSQPHTNTMSTDKITFRTYLLVHSSYAARRAHPPVTSDTVLNWHATPCEPHSEPYRPRRKTDGLYQTMLPSSWLRARDTLLKRASRSPSWVSRSRSLARLPSATLAHCPDHHPLRFFEQSPTIPPMSPS